MDIKSIGMRVSTWLREKTDTILGIGRLVIVALLFFGSGILYAQHFLFPRESFTIRQSSQESFPSEASALNAIVPHESASAPVHSTGAYVASKNGKNYYKVSCKNKIKEENKVYFKTEENAKKAGYAPSATCFK